MTYITDGMRAALAEHRLTQVCNCNGVQVFRMGTPHMGMNIVFLSDRIGITEVILGQYERGLWSDSKRNLAWFSGTLFESHLCRSFLQKVWVPSAAADAMRDKLQALHEDFQSAPLDECSKTIALREAIAASGSLWDPTRNAWDFKEFWTDYIDPDGPEDLGYDYDPAAAGWLCAIQQRFAELYREREARIEAIVAGWEWGGLLHLFAGRAPVSVFDAHPPVVAAIVPAGDAPFAWAAWSVSDAGDRGTASSLDAAKADARAAVLKQAKEHPELWYCESPGDSLPQEQIIETAGGG